MQSNVELKRKKLCYVLPEASGNTHMKYNVEFLESLAKEKGIDIYLILERGERGREHLQNLKEKIGVKKIKFSGSSFPSWRIIKMLYYLTDARLRGYKKVYVHYSFIGAFLASISNPQKQVYYWNCGIPWQYKRPWFQEFYESSTYKLVDHFVTGAEVLTSQYSKFYKFNNKKSIVIPNWIDVSKERKIFENTDKATLRKELNIEDQKVLFFNQRLAERKGAHYIPHILNEAGKNCVMIITNDGPYKEKLIIELKEKNLFDQVRMLGRVPNEKVIQLLSITDLYILPSEEEGMSHSLMEAFVCSVPAVSFAVGGTIDMYPESFKQYCVNERNIKLFIEKTNELLNDQNKSRELGTSLYEKVKEYDKQIVLNVFIEKILV